MKISPNDYCPCGSGKKYKHCHWGKGLHVVPAPASPASDESDDDLAALDPARADVMSPVYWEKMARRLPPSMRKEFGPMIAQVKRQAEMQSQRARIGAAAEILEQHRAEFEQLSKNTSEMFRRAEELFGEERFADMRFSAAEVQRGFDRVGFIGLGQMTEADAKKVGKAVVFLRNKEQREALARRLFEAMPDYVDAGRYVDAWIIQHSADLTAEATADSCGVFLVAMFLHGLREWERQRDEEQLELFRQCGIDPDKIREMGYEGLDAWMRDVLKSPERTAAMEAFLMKHPELNAVTQAQCRTAEEASAALLRREEGRVLHLAQEELDPWLHEFERRTAEMPGGIPSHLGSVRAKKKAAKALAEIMYDVASEMAETIFTPARIAQLKAQLHELRRKFTEAGDAEGMDGVHGALTGLAGTDAPADRRFLVGICWESLLATIHDVAQRQGG
jgi:hypothetical protein